jgi:Na+-driven multidrug efflux pump
MFGGVGAAHATLAANLISALILLALVRKVTGKLYFFREFLAFYLMAALFQTAALAWLA